MYKGPNEFGVRSRNKILRTFELRRSGKERLKIFEKNRDELQRSSEEDGKLLKRFQAIFKYRQRYMESF